MLEDTDSVLNDPSVRAVVQSAWLDSNPGVAGGHEEGGFVLRDSTGTLSVLRWPSGEGNAISVPPHRGCKLGDREIVATFHTHPNTGSDYIQGPSETDRRAVRDDPDLKGAFYKGEFVISNDRIYRIDKDGVVHETAETAHLFD